MLLTAMHDNPNQGFWQANAKNNPPAIIKESTVSPDTVSYTHLGDYEAGTPVFVESTLKYCPLCT